MCKAMEDMRNEAAKMKAVHIARLMLDGGKLSYEDIAAYTELTIEEVEKIASEKNHMEYINRNYSSFRTQIHEDKDKAINEEYSGNYLVGPRKNLLVDPQKDIDVKYIAIGGVEREDKSIEESHEIVKCKPADNLEIASWNSFVRKLDEYHGHHPVQ